VAYPGTSAPDREAAQKPIDETFAREPAGLFRALPDVPACAGAGDCAAGVGGGGEV